MGDKKMRKTISSNYIDEEEKEIIESLKDLDLKSIKNDTKNINKLKNAAKDYIKKQDKTITLRISSEDLEKIKVIASKKGLKYQTFIKSIIHSFLV
jgi:predicted DNA binding CopG/RHH family protein